MQEGFEKYLKAGKIAAEIREASKALVKPNAKILDIAEALEKMIKEYNEKVREIGEDKEKEIITI